MPSNSKTRSVAIGMSGGVDSSVAAALLVEQGYDVTGLFMKNWEEDDKDGNCNAEQDLADARQVCKTLGINLETVNFSYEYWERVFSGFVSELKSGRTPNPDIVCNVEIKFKEFPQWALRNGTDFVATGHYARLSCDAEGIKLRKGADSDKDQTYFLYALRPDALSRAIFPIGHLTKDEVRLRAKEFGFSNFSKKGSTGICFIGRRNFRSFISRYTGSQRGVIETPNGKIVGEHDGAFLYTIGQRTGLGIGGPGQSWYVASKDVKRNALIAVQGHDHPLLYSRVVRVSGLNWISRPKVFPAEVEAKVRYRGEGQNCLVREEGADQALVEFEVPARAVTPGQSIVFYDQDVCLGGALIDLAKA